MSASRPQVLVTGASGLIGRDFVRASEGGPLDIVRSDLHDGDPGSAFPFLRLDVTDADACRAACEGIDAVVHLAADPSPDAPFAERVLPLNIVGTYHVLVAAMEAGVRRAVFASSIQAVDGYSPDRQVRETDPPCPANDYGVGKAFGEALCARVANTSGTTCVAVRIGHYRQTVPPADEHRNRTVWLSPRDAAQLLELAVTTDLEGSAVVHGTSDNRIKRLSLETTRRLLGYAPRDDAFAAG